MKPFFQHCVTFCSYRLSIFAWLQNIFRYLQIKVGFAFKFRRIFLIEKDKITSIAIWIASLNCFSFNVPNSRNIELICWQRWRRFSLIFVFPAQSNLSFWNDFGMNHSCQRTIRISNDSSVFLPGFLTIFVYAFWNLFLMIKLFFFCKNEQNSGALPPTPIPW